MGHTSSSHALQHQGSNSPLQRAGRLNLCVGLGCLASLAVAKDCMMPDVEFTAVAGSCREAKGSSSSSWSIPDGEACTPWCALGYRASEERLECRNGALEPKAFTCRPLGDCKDCDPTEVPETYEISKCMDDYFACGQKRLRYATHLAQAGNWEAIDDESWKPKWPPP
mmetsp:Transcript_59017/g.140937  ORF Transcript_59017/g.140937 Transcript_59017/m.140937 type:complete len:168 (+) Transcript_59017:120-623(+)